MKKLLTIIPALCITLLLTAPASAFLGLSCNPENKGQYQGVDCAQCHGPGASWDTLCGAFDPQKAVRIVYESPRGCDEVSGTITLKASVQGTGAPVAEGMRYELRTVKDGTPIVLTGTPPSFTASFDTTTVRNGFVAFTAIPLDASGAALTLPGIIPKYRGFMVNNGLDLSKPLIVMGAPLHPYSGPFTGWDAGQLKDALTFSLNISEHLKEAGFLPEFCFTDTLATVLDPADPLASTPGSIVDLMGDSVSGTPAWNTGVGCLSIPFFEVQGPNGLDDMYENTAWDTIRLFAELGVEKLSATPQAINFFKEVTDGLTNNYRQASDWYNTFQYQEPVRGGAPKHTLTAKLKAQVQAKGITSILIFGCYHAVSDFEVSGDAWPAFQEAVDEINQELGTSVRIGAVNYNDLLLVNYESFQRSQYLTAWELVKSANIPAGKKVGIISAAHGSGKTSRTYDVSTFHKPVIKKNIEDFVTPRLASIYTADTPFTVCYSESANAPSDGLRGVGEQVYEWVNEGYDYIVVYPMEWPWGSTEVWEGLRKGAVELVDPANTAIFKRDARQRSEIVLRGKTHLIIGESMFEQKPYNAAPYHFYRAANTQLLEDRMVKLTSHAQPRAISGTLTLTGGPVSVSQSFTDSLAVQGFKAALQNAGVRATGISIGSFVWGMVNREDMGNYLFALLAENGYAIEKVQAGRGTITAWQNGGTVTAAATATINGTDTSLNLKITLQ